MKKDSIYIYSSKQLGYRFNEDHPFNHIRLESTFDLLQQMDAIHMNDVIPPRIASDEEIALIHQEDYIAAVKKASKGELKIGEPFGLGTEDTPIFPDMHNAAALIVGGTLQAVDEVMEGRAQHALHLGGGLHHGFRGKASGFCIYNDSSIAIEYMRKHYQARVLYVDTDAHHGDGVQWTFYDDPNVCTLSIHETGRYLFPGTGQVHEKGSGQGYGFSINVPIDAFTEDESFLTLYETAFREVIDFFKPDVILTQNGADAHFLDPLTHLCSSMKTYKRIPQIAHELAHQFCNGRWIAVGGGGYDIWNVVPRAWSYIWLAMTNQLDNLPEKLPEKWIERWKQQAKTPLLRSWMDTSDTFPDIPRRAIITEKNSTILDQALYHIRNENKRKE
ncbi:acetoin utilization protein AcuC [Halalkalibacter hemicellulosilyticus]|uniref:Acetoin utilization protein AcuC n=1 Tax=Halalkalibacter hemicellulosilyticusJCM 9152 TaxID=1236971 RepID=W4QJZ6_9BACI|nr:acetoin utilization protein AcuC [Halalkalibacter hemicellulosilyticus]GAE32401.1 NAD-independent protein deacetylase AcuC [Halalkalibacter hemicellulosilyticusJCM 9152]